ncbi:unnamed protein product [Phytomonas sp. EM1]|nr:unnamed protein product [Phytomonas sp. EM1]|eukprot:CCW59864.1 unnamed protein product [Phytomonas sp. isolate EM1]
MESGGPPKDFKPLLPFNDFLSQSVKDELEEHRDFNSIFTDSNDTDGHGLRSKWSRLSTEDLDLFSNETVTLFKKLENMCTYYKLDECLDLVAKIRGAVNNELHKYLMHIEENYAAGFKKMLHQPSLGATPPNTGVMETQLDVDGLQTIFSSYGVGIENDQLRQKKKDLLEQCPKEWPTLIRLKVAQDIATHHDEITTPLPRRLTVKEALSSITGLFAESLATLLSCEVVRVYLYDENHNLHCCATFPFHAKQGDPMRATYEEIMLVKDLHQTICGKCIAVNGREEVNVALKDGDMERIRQEMTSSGLGSIRSCLIFPIVSSDCPQCALGMLHAVNKVCAPPVDSKKGRNFSADDELLLSMASRVLGCVLTRYPVSFFSLRVGEAIRKAVFPHEDNEAVEAAHLHAELLQDPFVEDASGVGSRAMTSTEQIKILRASVTSVYQTSTHRQRLRRMGNLGQLDTTLSSVEFNLNVMNELWKTGITENVAMHQQYRQLEEELKKTKLLLENVLDGLSAVRAFHNAEKMAQCIQTLELYARSKSIDILTEFIHNMIVEEATREGFKSKDPMSSTTLWSSTVYSPKGDSSTEELKSSHDVATSKGLESSPFLTQTDMVELRRHQERLNAKVASRIHFDGPEGIRSYSCDPKRKREQIQFIEQVMCESTLASQDNLRGGCPPLGHPHKSAVESSGKNLGKPWRLQGNNSSQSFSQTDFALKRPFRLR